MPTFILSAHRALALGCEKDGLVDLRIKRSACDFFLRASGVHAANNDLFSRFDELEADKLVTAD